jgi:TRAP-type transport system periplasmic protein
MMYVSRTSAAPRTDVTTLRCATLLPPGYPPTRAWERFKELVEQRSDGRLNVELQIPFAGTELEALMRVRGGELDFASVTCFVASSLLPLAQIFDLPFLFADAPGAHAVLDGGLGTYVLRAFEPFGLRGMGYFENGIRHLTNSLRPVGAPADVRGMRVRIQDSVVYLALMHALRASPKVIPFEHVHDALQRGDVDAQENPLPNILGAKMHEVQRHLTLTAHAYNTQIVLAHAASLDRLSDADRAIVEQAPARRHRFCAIGLLRLGADRADLPRRDLRSAARRRLSRFRTRARCRPARGRAPFRNRRHRRRDRRCA